MFCENRTRDGETLNTYMKCNISGNKKVGSFKYSGSKIIAKEFKKK